MSPETALEIGRYQGVFGREVVVERALADADLGGDGIDSDGANALPLKQLAQLLKRLKELSELVRESHTVVVSSDHVARGRTAAAPAVKSRKRDRSRRQST